MKKGGQDLRVINFLVEGNKYGEITIFQTKVLHFPNRNQIPTVESSKGEFECCNKKKEDMRMLWTPKKEGNHDNLC